MKFTPILALPLLLACQSSGDAAFPERDAELRDELFATVAALEGRWEMAGEDGPQYIEFHVSSNGSAVREVMFPGTANEMTNMYTLDGNSLVMTHYCAGGNQPHMRATSLEDGHLAFTAFGVSDLASPDAVYMGDMTLFIEDEDHVEERWRALTGDTVDHMPAFALTRVR